MKHTILTITALILISCGGDSAQSIESIIESGDLEALKAKKVELRNEVTVLSGELAQIEKAIEAKDPAAKKEVLVTTMTVKDTMFNHYVEIQGNVETKQNVLVYPECF